MTGREQLAQPPRSSMRSDAEQNRARILAVARAALAESGEATLSSIAKLAGVGQGTMYRHFPTREVLLLAVYRQDVQAVIDAAPALLAGHPPAQAPVRRRRATRDVLLLEVYRQDVQAVIDAAPALLAAHPPDEALRLWFDRLASYGRIKHGLADALEAVTRADLSGEYYQI